MKKINETFRKLFYFKKLDADKFNQIIAKLIKNSEPTTIKYLDITIVIKYLDITIVFIPKSSNDISFTSIIPFDSNCSEHEWKITFNNSTKSHEGPLLTYENFKQLFNSNSSENFTSPSIEILFD